jgi:hypothetical protein
MSQALKIYSKGAPFYNVWLLVLPQNALHLRPSCPGLSVTSCTAKVGMNFNAAIGDMTV